MYKLKTYQDKIDALQEYYRTYGNAKSTGLHTSLENHPGFVGTKQWVFTNPEIFEISRINITNFNNTSWGVIINIELVEYLIKLGVNKANIKFYSDNAWRAKWATQVSGLNQQNVFMIPIDKQDLRSYTNTMQKKSVDYVLNNVPFGMFKEFKELAQVLAKEKALIISGSRDYKNSKSFENVEYYKYLGNKAFPTAQIIASLSIVNPNGVTTTQIIDKTGNLHSVPTATMQPPGDDIDGWWLATEVASLKLPGYNANMGSLYYEKTTEDPNGTSCIFTVGEIEKPNEFGRTKKISNSDLAFTKGLGEHKLVISKTGTAGKLGAMKYADPTWVVGFGTYFISFPTKQDVLDAIAYCQSSAVEKLVRGVKPNTVVNGQAIWKQIPHHSTANKWIHLA